MLIEINTDNNIEGKEKMSSYFESLIADALKRFEDKITRVEVQLGDENAAKSGENDKRCMLEARIAGLKPIAVVNHSDTLEKAVNGAINKLKHSLDHTFGKLSHH